MFVRDLVVEAQNDFLPAVEALVGAGKLTSTSLYRGTVESVAVADLAATCRQKLARDPLAFVKDAPARAFLLAKKKEAAVSSPLRVAILGSSTLRLLHSALGDELRGLLPGRRIEIYEPPFGQLQQLLLDPLSELRQWNPLVAIFCDRLEDILEVGRLDGTSLSKGVGRVESYCDLVASFIKANGGWAVVHRFASLGLAASSEREQLRRAIDGLNELMAEKLSGLSQVAWVELATEAAVAPEVVVDMRLWALGRIPYSEGFSRHLARRWAGMILATQGKTIRALVLDLDNTLWGGVLGEEGVSGIQLGGDFPGNAFLEFQKQVKALADQGVAILLCSKNDEAQAAAAIDSHPSMQFRMADVAGYRINWTPKWENIRELSSELNLGLESFLFVDDNPVEREAVRRNLPGVKVLELPSDPTRYSETLLASPWLETVVMTEEDRKRAKGYAVRRLVQEERRQAASLEDFLASLDMTMFLQPLDDSNIARAAQLSVKTNQFNATTRRHDQRALLKIRDDGGEVVVVGLKDRYSEKENIGLIILRPSSDVSSAAEVDTYLLSCRVLGKGLEVPLVHWALQRASRRGWHTLLGRIIDTERNTPVRGVFQDAGFVKQPQEGEWCSPTGEQRPLPPWLAVVDLM